MRVFVRLGLMALVSLAGRLVSAQSVVATQQNTQQTVLISGSYKNTELRIVLEDIAAKGNYKLWYTPAEPALREKVTITVTNLPVSMAFAQVLKGTGVTTTLSEDGKTVLVVKGAAKGAKATGIITGKVIDVKTGKGIGGANVSIDADVRGISTDENGSYRLAGVSVGNHMVTVRLVGYAKQTRQVMIGEGVTIAVDFKLEPSANVLDQVIVTGTVVSTELKAVPNAITVITAKQIEERGITRIDQLFRGDIPGLFAQNQGSFSVDGLGLDEVTMFSRGATKLQTNSSSAATNTIKTYIDGVELANSSYLSQIDPSSIDRIEILTGPQASTIYGSNAINGVMQIFTKRGNSLTPQITAALLSGTVQNNFSSSFAPQHDYSAQISGTEGRWSYNINGSWNYLGSWSPGKQTERLGGAGSGRVQIGMVTADMSLRTGNTKTLQNGSANQGSTANREVGIYTPNATNGRAAASSGSTLYGTTMGLTVTYTPLHWWSHELAMGVDDADSEYLSEGFGYTRPSDTLLSMIQNQNQRISERYVTNVRVPIGTRFQGIVTLGMDHWRSRINSLSAFSPLLITSISGPTLRRNRPESNTGGFLQSQINLWDALFLTYGLRAEWNLNYGDDAQPNLAPRYGVAYTRNIGLLTTKLRASYGRSTRPPTLNQKKAVSVADDISTSATYMPYYGRFDTYLSNADLSPEYQQGGEGGLELYFGNRGSLIVTRYNQTVDGLIASPWVDSVRSLNPNPPIGTFFSLDSEGYGYYYQSQNLNIGSVRNQGWELQGSINTGPFTTRGTYSWTKSRVIGITPAYRTLFANSFQALYAPGRSFDFLPEHVWALNFNYAQNSTTVSLNVNGTGFLNRQSDDLTYASSSSIRLATLRSRTNLPTGYRSVGEGYTTADLHASRRFTFNLEGVLQVNNLTDFYQNDYDAAYASIGRQVKIGARVRLN